MYIQILCRITSFVLLYSPKNNDVLYTIYVNLPIKFMHTNVIRFLIRIRL